MVADNPNINKKKKKLAKCRAEHTEITLPLYDYLHSNMALFVESYFCLPPEGLESD
jgi:hypothetical protein